MTTIHSLSCDVLVAGGGPAGVPCAIAAARRGARTILCQDRPVLGGNASSEIRMHIVGADCSGYRTESMAVEAREGGIIEEIRLDGAVRNPQRSASMLDLILYEACRAEPNLTLLLNTRVVGAEVTSGRITRAWAERPSTEDQFSIDAQVFVDCTGDGGLGAAAGAEYREGRESREEFGESLAGDTSDAFRLGSTLLFQARRHERSMPFEAPRWARKFSEHDLRFRHHASPGGVDKGLEYGYWWVEWGGHLDTIKDNETIRDELLAILLGVWDHIKNGDPTSADYPNPDSHGASHWALDWFGFVPGKRESRRFVGQHVLTEADVVRSIPQRDAIAFGGWPIDRHPVHGVDSPDETPSCHTAVPRLYDIPLRACVSRNVDNLMFAGRNLSATHVAFASTRVMATCAAVGQGVGTAAAFAVARGLAPADLTADDTALATIQQQLLEDDVYLIGIANRDGADLGRQAVITATSAQPNAEPEQIVSGQTRSVHGNEGAPADRARPGTHRWMSDPADGLPVSLTLSWNQPVGVGRIQFIFDTGMHRPLTLTQSDGYAAQMCWGRPQPETVRDYIVEGRVDGEWRRILSVTGNYRRRRDHRLETAEVLTEIRVTVTATNGLDHARIFEVRVYA